LFLDDLQWLDAATLEVLERLITDPDVGRLMLVGAYRDNEVSSSHPLMRTLGAIRNSGARMHEIVLAPLGLDDVGRLVEVQQRRPLDQLPVPMQQRPDIDPIQRLRRHHATAQRRHRWEYIHHGRQGVLHTPGGNPALPARYERFPDATLRCRVLSAPKLAWTARYHGPLSLENITSVFRSTPFCLSACTNSPTLESTSSTASSYKPSFDLPRKRAEASQRNVWERVRHVEKEWRSIRFRDECSRLLRVALR
jgi:hypothetical protein